MSNWKCVRWKIAFQGKEKKECIKFYHRRNWVISDNKQLFSPPLSHLLLLTENYSMNLKQTQFNEHGDLRMPYKQTFQKQIIKFKSGVWLRFCFFFKSISVQLPINPFWEIAVFLCSKKKKSFLWRLYLRQGFLHTSHNAETQIKIVKSECTWHK